MSGRSSARRLGGAGATVALLLSLSSATACSRGGATASGKELYGACTSCHGDSGLGDRKLGAPSIAGLPAWYVEAQVTKFKTGARGAHPDDFEGLRMRPMAKQMMNEGEVKAVAAYVASLPRTPITPTLEGGNASAGAASFGTCTACHGASAQGNENLKAPPLAGQADWYLLAQLRKFKTGIRGVDPKDASGAMMRPMALTLPTDQAMLDVVAHVSKLSR
jgi:cytochrome c553